MLLDWIPIIALILFVVAFFSFQIIFLFGLRKRLRRSARFKVERLAHNENYVSVVYQGHSYKLPVKDISRSGLSFLVQSLDKDLKLESKLDLEITMGDEKVRKKAKLVYIKFNEGKKSFRIGVKFNRSISNKNFLKFVSHSEVKDEDMLIAS